MLKSIIIPALLLSGSAAIAQPAADSVPSNMPADSATGAQASPGAATPASETANSGSSVTAAVQSGWAQYDADGSGELSQAEFTKWISDLKTAELQQTGKAADSSSMNQYAMAAWKTADRNGDKKVSKDELTGFLGG